MSKTNTLSNLTKTILKNISGRSKDIIEKRFGLFSDKEYTLHSIGTTLKITRERVRQIEKEGLKTLKKSKIPKELNQFITDVKKILKNNGGFCEQVSLFTTLKKKYDEKNVEKLFVFLTALDESIIQVEKNNYCKSYWAIDKQSVDAVEAILKNINSLLSKANKPLSLKQIIENLADKKLTDKMIESILLIDNKISKNPINEYGLVRWPVIQPYSARDKAYYLMKYYIKKPVHFQELSNLLKKQNFPKIVQNSYIIPKKHSVSLQTIHNELIKDDRFILIGHGVYALQEWGYEKGVVKDVIVNILQASNKGLSETEITQCVRKQRLVKDNTIRLSLRDKDLFQKNDEGKYVIRNAEAVSDQNNLKENKNNSNILDA